MIVKLSKWAKENGYSYRGAYNRFRAGNLKGAFLTETGCIFIKTDEEINKNTDYIVTYARVSSHKQKNDLDRQSERLSEFCCSKGFIIKKQYKEIASGLNDNRKMLNEILSSNDITTIIVENKDRLTRFGFNYISKFSGKKVIVVNESKEDKEDLIQDLISLITSMVARYYGNSKSLDIKNKILNFIKND